MVKSKLRHHTGGASGPDNQRKAFGRRVRFHDRVGKKEIHPMDPQKMALNELLFTDRDGVGNVLRKHWQQDESRRWAKANVKIVSLGPGSFKGADQLSSIIDRLKRQHGTVQKVNESDAMTDNSHNNNMFHGGGEVKAQYNRVHTDFKSDAKSSLSSAHDYKSMTMNDLKQQDLDFKHVHQPHLLDPTSADAQMLPAITLTSSSSSSSSSSSFSSLGPITQSLANSQPPPILSSSSSSSSNSYSSLSLVVEEKQSFPSVSSPFNLASPATLSTPHLSSSIQSLPMSPVSSSSSTSSSSLKSTINGKAGPARRLLTLTSFEHFRGLHDSIFSPGCFVALDIDDTLLHTRHSPSFLLSDFGVRMFQSYTHQRFTEFSVKNQHCRRLQNALKDKVTVEPCTAEVVRYLQDKGCWVFALTARFSEMAESTKRSLQSVGIDMTRTCPFPKQVIQDPETHSVCREGVIYCNSMDKGIILNRFLENVVFFSLIENVKKNSAASNSGSGLIPPGFIFVDDNAAHAHAILANLKVCDTLSIPITCYHYTPSNDDHGSAWDMPQLGSLTSPTATAIPTMDTALQHNTVVQQILQKQMQVFVDENKVLTNREAYHAITSSTSSGTKIPSAYNMKHTGVTVPQVK